MNTRKMQRFVDEYSRNEEAAADEIVRLAQLIRQQARQTAERVRQSYGRLPAVTPKPKNESPKNDPPKPTQPAKIPVEALDDAHHLLQPEAVYACCRNEITDQDNDPTPRTK